MPTFKDKKHLLDIAETIHCYLGQKSPDCILYSQDGYEFQIHKVRNYNLLVTMNRFT